MWNVLLVDDEQSLLNLYESALKPLDCRVTKASNGLDGFMDFSDHDYDLMIIDLKMPKLTGEELLTEILATPHNQKAPVLIVSGFIDDEVMEKYKNNSRVSFMHKPFSVKELVETASKLLSP